jgi:hypothetical protein
MHWLLLCSYPSWKSPNNATAYNADSASWTQQNQRPALLCDCSLSSTVPCCYLSRLMGRLRGASRPPRHSSVNLQHTIQHTLVTGPTCCGWLTMFWVSTSGADQQTNALTHIATLQDVIIRSVLSPGGLLTHPPLHCMGYAGPAPVVPAPALALLNASHARQQPPHASQRCCCCWCCSHLNRLSLKGPVWSP